MPLTDFYAVPRRCGACGHDHFGPTTSMDTVPPCSTCGCAAYALDTAEMAVLDAADAVDAAEFGGGERILTGDFVAGIHRVAQSIEETLNEQGWDKPPMIGVMHIARPAVVGPDLQMLGVTVAMLDLGYSNLFQMCRGDTTIMLHLLAQMADERPQYFDQFRAASGIDKHDPVVAWWCAFEAYAKAAGEPGNANDNPELRRDEIRSVIAVDVDERIHEIGRLRYGGDREASMYPMARYQRVLDAEKAGRYDDRIGMSTGDGRIPSPIANLLKLLRICRAEREIVLAMRTP